jgi:hypothetical protein
MGKEQQHHSLQFIHPLKKIRGYAILSHPAIWTIGGNGGKMPQCFKIHAFGIIFFLKKNVIVGNPFDCSKGAGSHTF